MIQYFNIFLLAFIMNGFSMSESKLSNEFVYKNYSEYHVKVIEAEVFIADENFQEALDIYNQLFDNYDFVFVREYKIATQLAVLLNQTDAALEFLNKGILAGWDKKSISKNKLLSGVLEQKSGKEFMSHYKDLHVTYEEQTNDSLKNQVHDMFKRDQKLAIKALFKLSSKSQDKYAEKKFAPHSETQMSDLKTILKQIGYPGEKIIGNDIWMSTILSHHNSISKAYVEKDTLYPIVRPKLLQAIERGEMAPVEFAMIDEWRFATMTDPTEVSYGFLEAPYVGQVNKTDSLRAAIGLRSIELRNLLVDVEGKTSINMYLFGGPWVEGKIVLR